MIQSLAAEFHARCAAYTNTAAHNDSLLAEFASIVHTDPVLSPHRSHVEKHKLGFGEPGFHHLWHLLLAAGTQRFGAAPVHALEIGVFKGQVISLWALLARHHALDLRIHAVSPLAGQPLPALGWWRSLRYRLDSRFRERIQSGDFYDQDNYEAIVRAHFAHHGLDFDQVRLHRGYSTEPAIRAAAAVAQPIHLLYIDGDHTYEGASADIRHYAPLVPSGGWLIMDDAAADLPGSFWKGYETVTRACRLLPDLGFKNVLNIGHNRVFERA